MDTVNLTIDGRKVTVPADATVLEAAEKALINIPRLCYHPDLPPISACRLCVVEIKGDRLLRTACSWKVAEGMEVITNSKVVRESRKIAMELLLSRHPMRCTECVRNGSCELRAVADQLGIREISFEYRERKGELDTSSPSVVRDPSKCILCRRCVQTCTMVQSVSALGMESRGYDVWVDTPFGKGLSEVACVACGQCIDRCPVGALYENSHIQRVWDALDNPDLHVVVQTAPAVRVAIGEEFGMPAGSLVTDKLVAGLRRLGFDKVFDTDFTADLTIMEEGYELLNRLKNGGTLPLLTSCSPGWINFIEHFYPELLPHVSSCKSPQQMFGALAKTYYAQKIGADPKNIFSVSVMPCTAKKYESDRAEMSSSGFKDVDAVLTTREAATMMKQIGIHLPDLPDEEYDAPLGISTGAAVIFGNTGGVMEAALRTVYEVVTGKTLEEVEIKAVRGLEGVREAEVQVGDLTVRAAVANGLANARQLMKKIVAGEAHYHFIEIMACPGGCIGGGGQPVPTSMEIRKKRAAAIYRADQAKTIRKSHENPAVQQLYKEFLGEPNSHKAHELLHTHYIKKTVYQE
ncbi:MAG TPA: NADH-dependent [FeFe] hydrogenase, group A6 [bacterium]|nr:NADH-dependent [FeFe] hydrogenase, group A6 [bacterium]HOY43432.1 NADH-dependent [FeFe] hydrogenase, group A6 [bacterium]HPG82680.1 NADH-dependent [FeFe] hydrogenase, group A6 [bacterium]HPM58276.1 NADH-dependent [FeFe] hydrogenase, group A6 [bacterium]